MDSPDALSGIGVLVTRPEHQADALCALIEQAGGKAIRFPVLEIVAPSDESSLTHAVAHLQDYDMAVFISPNAVNQSLNRILAKGPFPVSVQIAAVGRASAKAVSKFGLQIDIFPKQRFDSEALLELPEMRQVNGKRILIFRGEGGRELLAETLKARGAEVDYAEAYRRARPKSDVGGLMKRWARGEIGVVTVTSNESLHNLYDMVGQLGRHWLLKTPLVVASERGVELAKELGFKSPILTIPQVSDEAIFDEICRWRAESAQVQ
ncbi:MAG: uroporphyrinogen-III synthase [Gammaproteobacteria bacterium]|nr:uroporphyrinogen-III synthase [Gammaproteobacteria bacterium]